MSEKANGVKFDEMPRTIELRRLYDAARKSMEDAAASYDSAMRDLAAWEEEVARSACGVAADGKHRFRGFAEAVGRCEHCGVDGGSA